MMRKDWALLAISFAEGDLLTPVQLQKSLFLLGRNKPDEVGPGFYDFQAYDYGPFDAAVYRDAEELAREGLVRIDREPLVRSWAEYAATPSGLTRSTDIRAQAPAAAVSYLGEAVAWTRQLTFDQLVSAIYEAFPDQRANSVFRASH